MKMIITSTPYLCPLLHDGEAHEGGDDGVGAADWPGEVGGDQLPDLRGHHRGHQPQHQRPLPQQRSLRGRGRAEHEDAALGGVVAVVERHVDHAVGPGDAGHHLAAEVDCAQDLEYAAEEESNPQAHSSSSHGRS